MNSTEFLITPFLKNPLDGCLWINTFVLSKKMSHIFPGSVFSPLNWKTGNESELNILNTQPEDCFQPSQTSAMKLFLRKQLTVETAIMRSSPLVVLCKEGVLTNFAKFTGKHLSQSLVFNEAVDLQSLTLSEKEIPAQMFSCEFCEISHNTIIKGPKKLSFSAKMRHCRCSTRF